MASANTVHIDGLNKLVRELQGFGVEVDDLRTAFGVVAQEGAERAAALAPRRTGRLAASIRGNRAKNSAVITAGRATVPYAAVINYGWPRRNIKPSRYMDRAAEQMEPVAVHQIEAEIQRAVAKRGLR